jgi:hypothetical protein
MTAWFRLSGRQPRRRPLHRVGAVARAVAEEGVVAAAVEVAAVVNDDYESFTSSLSVAVAR